MPNAHSVQPLSRVRLFVTPWTAACQASLSITNSQSLLKLMSITSVMPSNHLIISRPLLPPSIIPSIRVFSNESVLHIRWPKYWSFSFSINFTCIQIKYNFCLKESSDSSCYAPLKLKLQYLAHLMLGDDFLEKALMLEKTEGRSRRGGRG